MIHSFQPAAALRLGGNESASVPCKASKAPPGVGGIVMAALPALMLVMPVQRHRLILNLYSEHLWKPRAASQSAKAVMALREATGGPRHSFAGWVARREPPASDWIWTTLGVPTWRTWPPKKAPRSS
mmetsp:Transcript_35096/g.92423  ORF Transcript_35096/g.92423 Transcript_35096/m.92423 type:complete len:127 (-) Transcript_35096:415-795(-)